MKFADALDLLTSSRCATRRSWQGSPRNVRLIIPQDEPAFDGPTEVFIHLKGNRSLGKEFKTEAAAKKALTDATKDLVVEWKEFEAAQATWETASREERQDLEPGVRPSVAKGFYDDVLIQSRPVSRMYRLSTPYFAAFHKSGVMTAWTPSTEDVLADDWMEN